MQHNFVLLTMNKKFHVHSARKKQKQKSKRYEHYISYQTERAYRYYRQWQQRNEAGTYRQRWAERYLSLLLRYSATCGLPQQ